MSMNYGFLVSLISSLRELENSIRNAYSIVASRHPVNRDTLDRLEHYRSVIIKQRSLALDVIEAVNQKRWNEVKRHLKLINAMSELLHHDARNLVDSLNQPEPLRLEFSPTSPN